MKVIRNGVFETNSSSMHSLSIGDRDVISTPSKLFVTLKTYGWGYDVLKTPSEKVSYLMSLVASNHGFSTYYDKSATEDDFFEIPEIEHILDVLKSKGCELYLSRDSNGDFGDVDHQSSMPMYKFLDGVSLDEFIFNSKYSVIIDNDNH